MDGTLQKVPLFMSQRLILAIMACWGSLFLYSARANLSIAIICMIRSDVPSNDTYMGLSFSNVTTNPDSVAGDGNCQDLADGEKSASSNHGEFDWDKTTTSRLLSMYFYGYIFTQLPGGWLASRYGGKNIWGSCMFVCGVCCLLTPIGARTSIYFAYALRFILGFASGVTFPCIQSLLGHWAPVYERSKLSAITFTGIQVGMVVTLAIAGLLCEYGFDNGWGSIFYLCGTGHIVWVICWFYFVADTPEKHKRISPLERDYIRKAIGKACLVNKKQPVPWRQIFTSRPVWAIIITHICSTYLNYTLLTALPMFMKEALKFDIKKNGLLSSLPYLVYAVGNMLTSAMADHINERRWLQVKNTRKLLQAVSLLGTGAGLCIVVQMDCTRRYVAVALLCLSTLCLSFNKGGYTANYLDLAPAYAGIVFGIANTAGSVPGMVAPVIAAALTPNKLPEEWKNVFYVCGGVGLVGTIAFSLLADGELQPWAMAKDMFNIDVHVESNGNDKMLTDEEDVPADSALPLVTLPPVPQVNENPKASEREY